MKHDTEPGVFKIRGLIIPSAWDSEGNVLAVAVSTFDEDEYVIDRDGMDERLIASLREEVEVSGIIGIRDGVKVIKVIDYAIVRKLALAKAAFSERPKRDLLDGPELK